VIAAVATAGLGVIVWAVVAGHVVALVVTSVMTLGGGLLAKRMHAASKVRKAEIEAARGRTRWPRLLAKTLKDQTEVVEYESRMHPIVMLSGKSGRVAVGFAVMFIAALVATPFVGVALLIGALVLLLGFAVALVPGAVNWWFTRRCFTDRRVIVATGILNKKIGAVELRRIQNLNHDEPFISSVLEHLGFSAAWHWKFDTQVQNEPFNRLDWCFYPSPAGDILDRYVAPKKASKP
jgi:hypothetical protein